jgi:serine/threonine protein kinase
MSSNNDDTILPTRRPLNSGGIDGDTVLPSQNATGIHAPGDVIDNRYTVVREIGRGGMGVVYEVEDAITGDHYAVKRLLPDYASRPEIVQQFRTEGAASIRFTNQSRYFVSTQTVGLDDGHPYIVMQLVRYPTLRNRLDAAGGRLGIEEALPVLMEIAEGLAELHSLGYIHRDLKPENVFIHQQDADIQVMLVDFGLTKDGSDATATALRGAGTERYASPEQKKGLPTTATSDIYSFGVVAFEVLTGELPGVGDQITDYANDVPPDMASIIMQCLSTRPERRPKDGGALRAALAGATPVVLPLPPLTVQIPTPQPLLVRRSSSLRFPDLQVGAKVVIDGESLAVGRDYRCELDEGTARKVDVIVTWEGVDLFRSTVILHAGESQAMTTQKAYRIDCDVPDWCEVKDAKGQRAVFPLRGRLAELSAPVTYSLTHQGKVFDKKSVTPMAGRQKIKIEYGLGILFIEDVPPGFQVRVNRDEVADKFTAPISNGSKVNVEICVYDRTSAEVYRETVQLQSKESKSFSVPSSVSAQSIPMQTTSPEFQTNDALTASQEPISFNIVFGSVMATILIIALMLMTR